MTRSPPDRSNEHGDPPPPIQHPEPVIADVIVRIQPSQVPGAPALIMPVGEAPPTFQIVSPEILAQIDGAFGYFRARRGVGGWVIGEALPDQGWD